MSNLGQQPGIGQLLAMTPQLQQAFRLLQLPALELQAQVQQALESNVMLETDEEFDATWALDSHSDLDRDVQEHDAVGRDTPGFKPEDGELENPNDSRSTLPDHLTWQLELAPLPAGPRAIGRAIIEAINDDGYLTKTPQAIAKSVAGEIRANAGVVESVLAVIQGFDPAGVGARNASECIELQLARLEPGTLGLDAARKLARNHLELATSLQFRDLQRLTGFGGPELEAALALVRSCHERPGAAFQSLRTEYVVPDVFARRTSHGWSVELNPAATPRIRLNERSAAMVTGSAHHAVLRSQLQEARWLLTSLEIRNDTVLRVARAIVYRQKDFLNRNVESMWPMTLRDVAEAVEMQDATVSRVTAGKYLQTPRGVFEFRFFFSSPDRGRMMPAA